MSFDVEVYKKAGITKCDISRMFGVSRTTVHNWFMAGGVHPLIKDRVEYVTSAVVQATKDGKLPTKLPRSPDDRNKELSVIIEKYL